MPTWRRTKIAGLFEAATRRGAPQETGANKVTGESRPGVRILIAAVGSRGDVAPLTGLGTALRGTGNDVSIATYGMFEDLVTGCGLGFRLIPGDPQMLGASEEGQR
jgi:Glycosyltransferase family 28 N-terminal domain